MKLVFSIVHHDDAQTVTQTLTKSGFTSTRLATSGGFLMARNITLLIGVDEGKVQTVIDIIRDCCHSRKQMISPSEDVNYGYYPTMPVEIVVGGATIFVVDVERFEHV
ncbi:MAG: cyclic-di-AMP receptor [Oscillospiraceae bacterium]|nr:cyclic-di-AMP receptor [Oscillospiraceae bacterium]